MPNMEANARIENIVANVVDGADILCGYLVIGEFFGQPGPKCHARGGTHAFSARYIQD